MIGEDSGMKSCVCGCPGCKADVVIVDALRDVVMFVTVALRPCLYRRCSRVEL